MENFNRVSTNAFPGALWMKILSSPCSFFHSPPFLSDPEIACRVGGLGIAIPPQLRTKLPSLAWCSCHTFRWELLRVSSVDIGYSLIKERSSTRKLPGIV
jgi:hypothetical protein